MIVLQSRLSGMFFKNFGYWVAQVGEAVHFESRERAWKFIHEQRVTDVALREVSEQGVPELKGMQT
jgi:hypothetical protein